jgi:hypothetical protein
VTLLTALEARIAISSTARCKIIWFSHHRFKSLFLLTALTSFTTSSLALGPFNDNRAAAQTVSVHLLDGVFGVSAVFKLDKSIA